MNSIETFDQDQMTSEAPITPAIPTSDNLQGSDEAVKSENTSLVAAGDAVPPKKQAIVVYEGDERWQPPRQLGFATEEDASDDDEQPEDDKEATMVSGSDKVAHGDLLALYTSDSEVCCACALHFYP